MQFIHICVCYYKQANLLNIQKESGDEVRKKKGSVPMAWEDKEFFQNFYEEYKRYIYFTVCKFTSDAEEREDMVQDVTLRLIHNVTTLKNLNRYTAMKYILLTIKTVYIDKERQKEKNNLVYLNEQELESILIEQYIARDLDHEIDVNMAVAKLKEELPQRDWLVLEGKYLLELSQEEISNLIGVAPDSVRMVLHRAKEKARSILKQEVAVGGEEYE